MNRVMDRPSKSLKRPKSRDPSKDKRREPYAQRSFCYGFINDKTTFFSIADSYQNQRSKVPIITPSPGPGAYRAQSDFE